MRRDQLFARLPAAWQADIAAAESLMHVGWGLSNAYVYRLRHRGRAIRYLKAAWGRGAAELRDEVERTTWLGSQGVPVPRILDLYDDHKDFVALFMSDVKGMSPQHSGLPTGKIVSQIALALRDLHALPVVDCPFDETVSARLALADRDIRAGRVAASEFDKRNRKLSARQLYQRLVASAARPAEHLVVVHGDATFANIQVGTKGVIGFIDCGRCGRADAYTDLALVTAEIAEHFGEAHVEAFLDAYGVASWDDAKALFYLDLYELF